MRARRRRIGRRRSAGGGVGALHRAFAVVRPPGHHAECARAMGFCFFNNTVIAARAALTAYPERIKILLVDWDVHHGNGIQDLTYDDDAILYVSLHRRQEGFYPETGDAEEIGIGKGRGYNINVPWPEKGLSDADYLAAFDLLVLPVASARADLVVVAAGYDAAEGDPLGGMRVSDQGFALMTERLQALAGGRIVCALEGGYGLTATATVAAGDSRRDARIQDAGARAPAAAEAEHGGAFAVDVRR